MGMWRSKKFIIIVALAAALVIASVGGIVLAQNNGDDNGTQPDVGHAALLDKVCEIYGENTGTTINADELQKAFVQAQGEIRDEALQNYLQNLVDEDKITQEQADAYLEWWQSKPDVPFGSGFMAPGGKGPFAGFNWAGGFHRGGGLPQCP
jgi:LPS O-antigen subunit length determinant protein (WzzB/FepE family)